MNNLKLRFWSKKANKFITLPRVWMRLNGELNYDFDGEELEVNLFTGLKDKNGKEIYEGDIIKGFADFSETENEEAGQFEVGQFNCIRNVYEFIDKIEYQSCGFYCSKADLLLDDYQILEILGNIYQNPELLNKQIK